VTIRSFAPGALANTRTADMFVSMRRELDDLQRQLATGKKSDTYAGLGFERRSSLDARGKMAMLSGYQTTIESGTLRLKMMSQVAERLDKMAGETRSDLLGSGFDIGGDGRGTAQFLAEQRLREALDHLNSDLNGRFLFAGRSPEAAPVESYERIMNGDSLSGQAGLSKMIAERGEAELGMDGLGRLSTAIINPTAPALIPYTVQLTGNGPAFPYGFTLVSAQSGSAGITASGAASGTPEQVELAVNAPPLPEEMVTVVVQDRGGASHTIQLKARTSVAVGERGVFQIGIDAATTATNLNAALRTAIQDKAGAVLKAHAAVAAAKEFFDNSPINPAERPTVPSPQVTATVEPGNVARVTGSLASSGFQITSTSSSGAIANVFNGPPTTPEYADFTVAWPVGNGDTIQLQLQDSRAQSHTVVLTAKSAAPIGPNDFQIGIDAASTVTNLVNRLNQVLAGKAEEVLMAEATTTTTARSTLKWYKGEDDGGPDRATSQLRIDTTQMVGTGARANEDAISTFLAQLGVLADARFQNTPVDRERYQNLTGRIRDNLSPPYGQPRLEELATDLGGAMATLQGAKDRHRVAANMLQDTLDKVEQASTEETAAIMLNLQTRMQASYQTTSILARLSIVNYLG
jgi:flagellin-like hook-associated protein FlgL